MDTYTNTTVIILAGTKWQIPLIQKLKKKGCRVIVFNSLPNSPAFTYADDNCIVDILDLDKCLKLAKEYAPDAIMSDECDIAVLPIAFLSEKLGLVSIGTDIGELYTNNTSLQLF